MKNRSAKAYKVTAFHQSSSLGHVIVQDIKGDSRQLDRSLVDRKFDTEGLRLHTIAKTSLTPRGVAWRSVFILKLIPFSSASIPDVVTVESLLDGSSHTFSRSELIRPI